MSANQPAQPAPDVEVEVGDDFVAVVEMRRPPHNFFDAVLLNGVADALGLLEDDERCRAIVLASHGRNFCAGAQLGGTPSAGRDPAAVYDAAVRLFTGTKPIVAAVQGAAVGGGLGLALVADFRVASADSRFTANFAQLGFFPGFGLTVLLPRVVGAQVAMDLLYTGRRIDGIEANAIGLCDRLVGTDQIRAAARLLAAEIAASAPRSVQRIRRHLRGDLVEAVRAATERERHEQVELSASEDFREGVRAMTERRTPRFTGR